jgi:hypothetical protein
MDQFMATTDKRKTRAQNRTHSKESYRLWFEFLKRALAEDRASVKLNLYKSWGDVEKYKFNKWWTEIGSHVINLDSKSHVEIATDTHVDDSSYLIRVPKTLTSTQAATQLRELLTASSHKPIIEKNGLRVNESKEIRHIAYRAYLHTYDRHRELVLKNNGKKVTNKETLIAVRKFYIARYEKYKNRNWQADNLPTPLYTAMNMNNLDDVHVLDSTTAISAIARYLREAEKIVEAVKNGKFPE